APVGCRNRASSRNVPGRDIDVLRGAPIAAARQRGSLRTLRKRDQFIEDGAETLLLTTHKRSGQRDFAQRRRADSAPHQLVSRAESLFARLHGDVLPELRPMPVLPPL